jgi:hypothetical protein
VKGHGGLLSLLAFPFFLTLPIRPQPEIKLIAKFSVDQSEKILLLPGDMAVSEDEEIYFTDRKDSNIKVYSGGGKLLREFGTKGQGPNEFEEPYTIDIQRNKICFFDRGRLHYYVYDIRFSLLNHFFYPSDAAEFVLHNDQIISNDYFRDDKNKEYRGLFLGFDGKVKKLLFPILFDNSDFENRFYMSFAFLDTTSDGRIFFVHKKNLEVVELNSSGDRIKVFRQVPGFYKKPQLTEAYKDALRTPQNAHEAWENWYRSFTWVTGLAALKNGLVLTLANFNESKDRWEYWMQIYDLKGTHLSTTLLVEPGSRSPLFFLDSNHADLLYVAEATQEDNPEYAFYKYRVTIK